MSLLARLCFVVFCSILCLSEGAWTFSADNISVQGHASVGSKRLAGAVVWLEAPDAPRPPRRAVLDQRNLAFSPTVVAVSTGSTVRFPNNDRVLHNVFSFRDGKKFDLGLYPVGQVGDVKFDRGLTAEVNHIRQAHDTTAYSGKSSLDVGLTYTIRPMALLGNRDR